MIPLKIKLCLSFFIVVKNKALVKAQMKGKGMVCSPCLMLHPYSNSPPMNLLPPPLRQHGKVLHVIQGQTLVGNLVTQKVFLKFY